MEMLLFLLFVDIVRLDDYNKTKPKFIQYFRTGGE